MEVVRFGILGAEGPPVFATVEPSRPSDTQLKTLLFFSNRTKNRAGSHHGSVAGSVAIQSNHCWFGCWFGPEPAGAGRAGGSRHHRPDPYPSAALGCGSPILGDGGAVSLTVANQSHSTSISFAVIGHRR